MFFLDEMGRRCVHAFEDLHCEQGRRSGMLVTDPHLHLLMHTAPTSVASAAAQNSKRSWAAVCSQACTWSFVVLTMHVWMFGLYSSQPLDPQRTNASPLLTRQTASSLTSWIRKHSCAGPPLLKPCSRQRE